MFEGGCRMKLSPIQEKRLRWVLPWFFRGISTAGMLWGFWSLYGIRLNLAEIATEFRGRKHI